MERTNCPNCGAPLSYFPNHHCEYCGTNIPKEPQMHSGIKMDASGITVFCEPVTTDYLELWADNVKYARIPVSSYC